MSYLTLYIMISKDVYMREELYYGREKYRPPTQPGAKYERSRSYPERLAGMNIDEYRWNFLACTPLEQNLAL